jgi:glycosyltransferase involved in cell wall biosynthesis
MRVVIAALTAPTQLNGVSRHAASLACGLSMIPSAPEIHFVAGAWQREMFSKVLADHRGRVHCHWVSSRNNNFNRLAWYYRDLPKIASQLETDLLHYVCPAPLHVGELRCPTVVSLHDLYPFEIPGNFGYGKGILNRLIMRQCLEGADAIACVSATTRRTLEWRLGQKMARKAVTIFNIVDPEKTITTRVPQALREGDRFLVCIAQHRRNKNLPLALSIFQHALRAGVVPVNTLLLIVGITGPMTREIRKQVERLSIEQHVVLVSGLSDEELQWCYRHCEMLLAPSQTEGFGLPVAEASLVGCPVVCSDIPAFREIDSNLCHYISLRAGHLSGWIEAIRESLAQPRIPVPLPHLSGSVVAQEYAALYRSLLASPRRESQKESWPPGPQETESNRAGTQSV